MKQLSCCPKGCGGDKNSLTITWFQFHLHRSLVAHQFDSLILYYHYNYESLLPKFHSWTEWKFPWLPIKYHSLITIILHYHAYKWNAMKLIMVFSFACLFTMMSTEEWIMFLWLTHETSLVLALLVLSQCLKLLVRNFKLKRNYNFLLSFSLSL